MATCTVFNISRIIDQIFPGQEGACLPHSFLDMKWNPGVNVAKVKLSTRT